MVGEVFVQALAPQPGRRRAAAAHEEIKRLNARLEAENVYLRQAVQEHSLDGPRQPLDRGFNEVLEEVRQVAPTPSTVLLLGETGTGKELLARAIHD